MKLTEEAIFKILENWSKGSFFRLKNLSKKLTLKSITEHPDTYVLRFRSQFEKRTKHMGTSPYRGEKLDNIGTIPSIGDITLPQPAVFESDELHRTLPHSDSVCDCHVCRHGIVDCDNCNGSGHENCSWCYGFGTETETYWEDESYTDSDGEWQTRSVSNTRTVSCSWCLGSGTQTCTPCGGSGTMTCPTCDGTTQLLNWWYMIAKRWFTTHVKVLTKSEVPNEQLREAGAVDVVRERDNRVHNFSEHKIFTKEDLPKLHEETLHLRKEALASYGDDSILFQEIEITKVPVTEVETSLKSGKSVLVWIFGTEDSVYAPTMPVSKSRSVIAFIGICILIVGGWYTVTKLSVPPAGNTSSAAYASYSSTKPVVKAKKSKKKPKVEKSSTEEQTDEPAAPSDAGKTESTKEQE